jgi:hypothetical protein
MNKNGPEPQPQNAESQRSDTGLNGYTAPQRSDTGHNGDIAPQLRDVGPQSKQNNL